MKALRPGGVAILSFLISVLITADTFAQSSKDLLKIGRQLRNHSCALIEDPAGNAGPNPIDFTRLFIGNDDTNVYFVAEFAEPPSGVYSAGLFVNTDFDQTTGCDVFIPRLNGAEYGVFFYDPSFSEPFVGNLQDGC